MCVTFCIIAAINYVVCVRSVKQLCASFLIHNNTLLAVLWRTLIKKQGGLVSPSLDVSSLAKITDGYTPGQMHTACTRVLTERRINQLSKKPLQSVEFVTPLARLDPVYKEEEEAFKVSHSGVRDVNQSAHNARNLLNLVNLLLSCRVHRNTNTAPYLQGHKNVYVCV